MQQKVYNMIRGNNPNDKNLINFSKTFNRNKTFYLKNGSNSYKN